MFLNKAGTTTGSIEYNLFCLPKTRGVKPTFWEFNFSSLPSQEGFGEPGMTHCHEPAPTFSLSQRPHVPPSCPGRDPRVHPMPLSCHPNPVTVPLLPSPVAPFPLLPGGPRPPPPVLPREQALVSVPSAVALLWFVPVSTVLAISIVFIPKCTAGTITPLLKPSDSPESHKVRGQHPGKLLRPAVTGPPHRPPVPSHHTPHSGQCWGTICTPVPPLPRILPTFITCTPFTCQLFLGLQDSVWHHPTGSFPRAPGSWVPLCRLGTPTMLQARHPPSCDTSVLAWLVHWQ